MNILFHENQLGLRGTSVALYDYAHYNETILNNISYIAAPNNSDMSSLDKFKDRFEDRIILYNDFSELYSKDIDVAYFIKAGFNDGKVIPKIKNIVHAVFDASHNHGNSYVAVSEWLGKKHGVDYLPHIVSLPNIEEDFREYLNISKESLVFGRYGGYDQFDLPYLQDVITNVLSQREDVYFIFMNTRSFYFTHPRLIYIEPTTDIETKVAFINTTDVMVHGRSDGESFGLSIAEFLHQDKPIITNIDGRDKNHITILKDKGFYYSSANELYSILMNFKKDNYYLKNLISKFSPEIVMQKFKTLL
jgi:hypothetical protein